MPAENEAAPVLPKARAIPEFASEEEERTWWASHDTSELLGQDVELRHAEPSGEDRARVVSVQVDQGTVRCLEELAAKRGLGYHALVRAWILERLRDEVAS